MSLGAGAGGRACPGTRDAGMVTGVGVIIVAEPLVTLVLRMSKGFLFDARG
jgi:hypothetical protein